MSFLELENKTILVVGVANKKSVAYHIGRILAEAGARVLYSVQNAGLRDSVAPLVAPSPVYVCDVEQQEEIDRLARDIAIDHPVLHGMAHSIAFADYSGGMKPFHETARKDFLQAVDISCFSLTALANALKDRFDKNAAVVTVSISTTRMAAENYGYMAPVKAALDSSLCFLAKSFSVFSQVRFNSVNAGLLKTSASAGIPGYIDSYIHAEKATLRKKGVSTEEVANAAVFLLSPRSSGINAQGIVIDAGMSINYFDRDILR
jgi:enoyl-[acyl-carrier protein] reductase I